MATKRSVGDLKEADVKGKRVFVRVDLNVPLDENLKVTDDTRIRATVPTIEYLMERGARIILASHLGRPKGVTPKYSLKPVVPRLSELLGVNVEMANDSIGEEVEKSIAALPNGGVVLLENVRFYKEEEKNDPEFAKKLASLADLYVNDAFGTAHRAHASTEGVTKFLKPSVAGFLMQKELDYLVGAVTNPKKPFAAIVGGSKVSSKIGVIESLLEKVDILILGGGMIFTFYKAQGYSVGSSLVEEDKLGLATSLLEKAKSKGVSLLLPTDVVIADKFAADADSKIVPASGIPDGWMGLDIGPDSIKTFSGTLESTKTIIWNGPMGVFEFEKFAVGTEAIAKKLADLSGTGVTTIIGGGDSVAAVEKVGLADKMSHISTGGGASLELLEGNPNLSIVPKSCEHFLPFNTKLLHHILISILLPKQHHLDEVNTLEINTMYWIMTGRDYCFGYLIRQNMIDISRKDIMLPYGGLITRLLHAHDITISPDEETMKLDKFNIINRNLLRRLRCIVINEIWTRLPRRIDPPPPKPIPNTPIHKGSHSPLTSPFEAIPPTDAAPSSSSEIIAARLDRLELRQDQILTEIQHIHQRLDTFNAYFHTLFRHFGLPKSE